MPTKTSILLLLVLLSSAALAVEIPRTSVILHGGVNALNMKPGKDSSIIGFKPSFPGIYFKVSGEAYMNARDFVHFDLNLSYNEAVMDNGYARISRLCMNYGFGKTYKVVKFTVSPGLCYSTIGYQNEASKKSLMENRFSPSLGLQTGLIIYQTPYQYLGLFIEGSLMIAKPSRCIHQLSAGIAWKPSFRKVEQGAAMP
jgi:hypothetical protein